MTLPTLRPTLRPTLLLAILLASATPAFAHTDVAEASGFASGFMHPLTGLDHLVAMVAVGLWGAFLGRPAIWILPVVFPSVMAIGGALGIAGVPMPFVETGIALSGVLLGLMVTFGVRAPLPLAAVLVGAFAIFHGHAHGTELPAASNPFTYAAGFVIATGLLHVAGILLGELKRFRPGAVMVRVAGALITLTGIAFLTGVAGA